MLAVAGRFACVMWGCLDRRTPRAELPVADCPRPLHAAGFLREPLDPLDCANCSEPRRWRRAVARPGNLSHPPTARCPFVSCPLD